MKMDFNCFAVSFGTAGTVDKASGIIIILIVIILLLVIALLVKNKRCSSIDKAAKETEKKLQESYLKLQSAYQEVTTTKDELNIRFEELKQSEDKNRKLAYNDYLTDLPNRFAFNEMLENTVLTLRKGETVAIMYIDLDNFKIINDTLGHSYGDELLIDVAYRLKEIVDSNDYLARFGGDEFIILTQNIEGIDEYDHKLKKIQKVFSYPFVLSMKEFFITISVGVVLAPKNGRTVQTLIKNVDAAMYEAKEMGKNTYYYFDEKINNKLMKKIELQSELRKAIDNNEFQIFYQAQIDLKTDRIVGFEALIRWVHPEKGLIYPDGFILLAEETGLIVPIGRWVLYESCKQLKRWKDAGYNDINVAVNLSVRQFRDADLVHMIQGIIDETGIEPKDLELEITESLALEDIEYTIEVMERINEMGIEFSLDDFGTGYSSMNYLKRLPVKNLKIDKSFIHTMMDNENEQKIVSTIINLAQILNLNVIAEGVEYIDQASFLKEVNCNKVQGYLYSEPINSVEAGKLLSKYYNKNM